MRVGNNWAIRLFRSASEIRFPGYGRCKAVIIKKIRIMLTALLPKRFCQRFSDFPTNRLPVSGASITNEK